jgi:predicted DCC family thiol-disulfide oxidoreductase YuxK
MENRHIVIFDGVCNFCNGAVNFIIKRDPQAQFVFSPMQTKLSQALMKKHTILNLGIDTF